MDSRRWRWLALGDVTENGEWSNSASGTADRRSLDGNVSSRSQRASESFTSIIWNEALLGNCSVRPVDPACHSRVASRIVKLLRRDARRVVSPFEPVVVMVKIESALALSLLGARMISSSTESSEAPCEISAIYCSRSKLTSRWRMLTDDRDRRDETLGGRSGLISEAFGETGYRNDLEGV